MIIKRSREQSIFDLKVDCICVLANAAGIPEKGTMLGAEVRFPDAFKRYQELCRSDMVFVGDALLIAGPHVSKFDCISFDYVGFLIVRQENRSQSSYEDAKKALKSLHKQALELNIKTLSVPYFHESWLNLSRESLKSYGFSYLLKREFGKENRIETNSFIHRARKVISASF